MMMMMLLQFRVQEPIRLRSRRIISLTTIMSVIFLSASIIPTTSSTYSTKVSSLSSVTPSSLILVSASTSISEQELQQQDREEQGLKRDLHVDIEDYIQIRKDEDHQRNTYINGSSNSNSNINNNNKKNNRYIVQNTNNNNHLRHNHSTKNKEAEISLKASQTKRDEVPIQNQNQDQASSSTTTSTISTTLHKDWATSFRENVYLNIRDQLHISNPDHNTRSLESHSKNSSSRFLGWTPTSYPDPIKDPTLCRIPQNFWNDAMIESKNASSTSTSTSSSSPRNIDNNHPPRVDEPVLLCDPDQVMNDDDLESIGFALQQFNSHYGRDETNCDQDGKDHNSEKRDFYNVGVSQDWRAMSRMSGTAFEIEFLNEDAEHAKEQEEEDFHRIRLFHQQHEEDKGQQQQQQQKVIVVGEQQQVVSNNELVGATNHSSIRIEIGVAIVRKLDIDAILNEFKFYTFEDEDNMVDDAAQFFASIVHSQWFNSDNRGSFISSSSSPFSSNDCDDNSKNVNGILIFLSVEDRVCFISSGSAITSILPWWRLERVVSNMKEKLRTQNYSKSIISAIQDISEMIDEGPPTFTEKFDDFSSRFGLVLLFSICTFVLAVYGEIRERQRRYEFAEINTYLTDVEAEKARMLQQSYESDCCPICLEDFGVEEKENTKLDYHYKMPLKGSDGKPVKMLRCGHVFCVSCWRAWIHSGNANPHCCPVCRQDVTRSATSLAEENAEEQQQTSATPLVENAHAENQSYGTIGNSSLQNVENDDDDPGSNEQLNSTASLAEETPGESQTYGRINVVNYSEDLEYRW